MNIILAADENWAIGNGGELLCHIPGDLKYFKKRTLNKTIVMGRSTLESLPEGKPLPNRNNIVLSTKTEYKVPGALVIHSAQELISSLEKYRTEDVFIAGGERVYKDFLPLCDTCYITKIYKSFKADRFFVNLDENTDFSIVWKSELQEENGIKYQFFEYKRGK